MGWVFVKWMEDWRALPVSEEKLIDFSSPCGSTRIKEGGGESEGHSRSVEYNT